MRILLVQSYLGRKGVSDQLVFPLGLSCVASALERAGHQPRIVDLNLGADPWERLEEAIRDFRPDGVGVSLRNIDSTMRKVPFVFHTQLRPTLELVRKLAPGVPTFIGGPGFTQSARAFMQKYPFDYGIQSEAEDAFPALLDHLDDPSPVPGVYWRDGEELRFTGEPVMPDFASLPFPRRHYVDWEAYHAEERSRGIFLDVGVETTRGCPRKCAYCNYPFLNGRKLRRKPPEVVVDELEYLQREFGVHHVTFTDSRFNEHPRHAREVVEGIIRRGLEIRWTAWLGFSRLDGEFLRLMQRAGCERVAFSPDGLLQPSLDRMRKQLTTEEIYRSIRAVQQAPGLKASWSFFVTPPSTSTAEQLAYLGAYLYIHGTLLGRGRMTLTWCRVEEGTHFETIAREDGVLPEDADLLPDEPEGLAPLFYVAPGFEKWTDFWDRFLDLEMEARVALGRALRPLRRFGFRDLTPPHLREPQG